MFRIISSKDGKGSGILNLPLLGSLTRLLDLAERLSPSKTEGGFGILAHLTYEGEVLKSVLGSSTGYDTYLLLLGVWDRLSAAVGDFSNLGSGSTKSLLTLAFWVGNILEGTWGRERRKRIQVESQLASKIRKSGLIQILFERRIYLNLQPLHKCRPIHQTQELTTMQRKQPTNFFILANGNTLHTDHLQYPLRSANRGRNPRSNKVNHYAWAMKPGNTARFWTWQNDQRSLNFARQCRERKRELTTWEAWCGGNGRNYSKAFTRIAIGNKACTGRVWAKSMDRGTKSMDRRAWAEGGKGN